MDNEELFGRSHARLLSVWEEYKRQVREHCPDCYAGYDAAVNPFAWLYKNADTALAESLAAGRLVKDVEGKYGVVVEPRYDSRVHHREGPTFDAVVVDFKGTRGTVIIETHKLRVVDFPPELLDFVAGRDKGKETLRTKVHEKVDEAFKA